MQTYPRAYFERTVGWGLTTEAPVFIVGMPRSGSTLVEQILASHPAVFGAGEQGEVSEFVARHRGATNTPAVSPPADARTARQLAYTYLDGFGPVAKAAARVTIKALENFLHLGFIATLFPNARIIHCRRDPLDVSLSCYFQHFQHVPFSCNLEDIGSYYRAYETLMAHWARVLPLQIHVVSYADLVREQEAVTRELLSFCGLDWDDRCLNFHSTPRVVRTASALQVRKPMYAHSIGRWKNYRMHLESLCRALGDGEKDIIAAPILPPPTGHVSPARLEI